MQKPIDEGLRNLKKYEFENRTSGGVVQFSDFEAAEAHTKLKKRLLAQRSMILGVAGTAVVLLVLLLTGALAFSTLVHGRKHHR